MRSGRGSGFSPLRRSTALVGGARHRARRLLGGLALRVAERLNGQLYLPLVYPPPSPRPRYGYGRAEHPRLAAIIGRHEDRYRRHLELVLRYRDDLLAIDREQREPREPYWLNDWLPGLDAASLYCFVRSRAPARYLEVGSGVSTLFAARAVRDGGLATSVTSLDPQPRAEIDAVCDRVIRRRLEDTSLAIFGELAAGDVLFVDGSHQVFMNSDATTFFLDCLPELAAGVLVGVHDIFLPSDYPPEWGDAYLSEQYLLASHLLAERPLVQPELACNYASGRPHLASLVSPLFDHPHFGRVARGGASFWFTKRHCDTEPSAAAPGPG